MISIGIFETEDCKELKRLFSENDVEFSVEEDEPLTVKMWAVRDMQKDGAPFYGGVVLACYEGEHYVAGIVVDEQIRGLGMGAALLEQAESEARERGAKRICVVARKPEFYAKSGYTEIAPEESPIGFDCPACSQYGTVCMPKVMVKEF